MRICRSKGKHVCNYYNDMAKKFKLDFKINCLMLMRVKCKLSECTNVKNKG